MSYVKPADRERKAGEEGEGGVAPTHRIRITLTSTKVKNLESVSSSVVQGAKEKGVKVKGPVRMPTRRLVHTTRRAPSGNGTNTFDRYEMRVHKRLIDLYSPADLVRQLTNLSLDPGVDIEVTIAD